MPYFRMTLISFTMLVTSVAIMMFFPFEVFQPLVQLFNSPQQSAVILLMLLMVCLTAPVFLFVFSFALWLSDTPVTFATIFKKRNNTDIANATSQV